MQFNSSKNTKNLELLSQKYMNEIAHYVLWTLTEPIYLSQWKIKSEYDSQIYSESNDAIIQ